MKNIFIIGDGYELGTLIFSTLSAGGKKVDVSNTSKLIDMSKLFENRYCKASFESAFLTALKAARMNGDTESLNAFDIIMKQTGQLDVDYAIKICDGEIPFDSMTENDSVIITVSQKLSDILRAKAVMDSCPVPVCLYFDRFAPINELSAKSIVDEYFDENKVAKIIVAPFDQNNYVYDVYYGLHKVFPFANFSENYKKAISELVVLVSGDETFTAEEITNLFS